MQLKIFSILKHTSDTTWYIQLNMQWFCGALSCFGCVIILRGFMWSIYLYCSGLLHWHWSDWIVTSVPFMSFWRIWVKSFGTNSQGITTKHKLQRIKKFISAILLFNRFMKGCQDWPPSINMILRGNKLRPPASVLSTNDFDTPTNCAHIWGVLCQ